MKKNSKKLQLKRETVQTLTHDALAQVDGRGLGVTAVCTPIPSQKPFPCHTPPTKPV